MAVFDARSLLPDLFDLVLPPSYKASSGATSVPGRSLPAQSCLTEDPLTETPRRCPEHELLSQL